MPDLKVLIYLLRRDLRVSDNPILHELSTKKDHGYTHLLPLYVFPAQQIEVKGFLSDDSSKSPYKEARSQLANFWRCGPHRAKFLGESVWDLKSSLEELGSGLCIRVGMIHEVINQLVGNLGDNIKVGGVWMVGEEGVEEGREERAVKNVCRENGVEFKLWSDEKYLIDDRDLPLSNIDELSDVFTTYRKTVEPLRDHPRPVLATPEKDSLPKYPAEDSIPAQHEPFTIPDTLEGLRLALLKPLKAQPLVANAPNFPPETESAHPFKGGETHAQERLEHLIRSGNIVTYQDTRNGLLGLDFSTKLSAYLVLGAITARQIHAALLDYEDGKNATWRSVEGYGQGENIGTRAIRFELLWRDYMRLCTRKFGPKLFRVSGFKGETEEYHWASPSHPGTGQSTDDISDLIERFRNGTTGMGLIDASMRELYHTGYTSNRARQNVASFFAKHLKVDWRIGAEWYESMLVDYDLSSNWGNWQYLAGVGNDPRGEARIFNPVKQAFDYDPNGDYVKAWVPELRQLTVTSQIFQAWTVKENEREGVGLKGVQWVEEPLLKIDFHIGRKGRNIGKKGGKTLKEGDGKAAESSSRGRGGYGGYGGRGYGSSRGHGRGHGRGGGGIGVGGLGRTWYAGGGREQRTGMMDRDSYYPNGEHSFPNAPNQ